MKIQVISAFCLATLFGCNATETPEANELTIIEQVEASEESTQTNDQLQKEDLNDKFISEEVIEEANEISDTPKKEVPAPNKVEEVESTNSKIEAVEEIVTVVEEVVENPPAETNFHEYVQWNSLLKNYVSSSGRVNYAGFKTDKAKLNAVCDDLKKNAPQSNWTKNQKLAYWINVYNAFTIKLVVDNYPTSSITKITAKPWDKKFITIGGNTYSLNNVENDIIRKRFNEPRIHFALNCASKSCPVLLNAAYTASNLNYRLTSQTKRFFKDTQKNNFSNPKAIKISKIFDWYKVDFTKNGKTVVDFINKYRTDQLSSPSISYMEYSWDLNK